MTSRTAKTIAACSLWMAAAATAAPLKVCVVEQEFVPMAEHEGPGQYLVRNAATQAGSNVQFMPAPWRRCVSGVRAGQYDAVIGAAASPLFEQFMRFPVKGTQADPTASIANTMHVVLRLRGSKSHWNGTRFEPGNNVVHFPAGSAIVAEKLATLNTSGNDSVKTASQLMGMLLQGRAELLVLRKSEAELLLSQLPSRDSVEMLPSPFVVAYAYLGVRRSLYEEQAAFVQSLWDSIRHQRAASDWASTERQLQARAQAWARKPK